MRQDRVILSGRVIATVNAGRIPIGGEQNQVSITAVKTITLPTAAQRQSLAPVPYSTAFKKTVFPLLEMWLTLEAQNARLTTTGTTPDATHGHLLISGGLGPFVFTGEELIASMKLISPTAGGLISYSFYFVAPT